MKVIFISAGPISWGSSRLRCFWVAEHLPDAQVIVRTELNQIPEADVYVFQKVGIPKLQRQLLDQGKQVWLDHCDPVWWFSPRDAEEMVAHCTGNVASSVALARDFEDWSSLKCHVIPDRMSLNHYNRQREHQDVDPVRLIWFGASVNRLTLFAAWANLARLVANGYNIELTIMDNQPELPARILGLQDGPPVYQTSFSVEEEVTILTAHDIALLPPYPGPWGEVKSNNKSLTAYACGLPTSTGTDYEDLLSLVEKPSRRSAEADEGRKWVEESWTVDKSAKEWEELWG